MAHDRAASNMRRYPKVPEILVPYLNQLPKFLFAFIPEEVVSFCADTVTPAGFPCSEALMKVV
jgi:hypothetical protein